MYTNEERQGMLTGNRILLSPMVDYIHWRKLVEIIH